MTVRFGSNGILRAAVVGWLLWGGATLPAAELGVPSEYGPVAEGETLPQIVLQVRGDTPWSWQSWLVAIYRANLTAFEGENIYHLRSGVVLRLPDPLEVQQIPIEEAVYFLAEQRRYHPPPRGYPDDEWLLTQARLQRLRQSQHEQINTSAVALEQLHQLENDLKQVAQSVVAEEPRPPRYAPAVEPVHRPQAVPLPPPNTPPVPLPAPVEQPSRGLRILLLLAVALLVAWLGYQRYQQIQIRRRWLQLRQLRG